MNRQEGKRAGSRNRGFVGRRRELEVFADWLADDAAPFRIFSVTGIGGIGKTTLMAEMARLAGQDRHLTVWIDGRTCPHTPAAFLESLGATLTLEPELAGIKPEFPLKPLIQATPGRRAILLIDNFESLTLLEGWLMDVFMPKLPLSGFAVALASRPSLSPVWITHPVWGRRVAELPLPHFSDEETLAYIRAAGDFPDETVGRLSRLTDGHPFALALATDSAIKGKGEGREAEALVSQAVSASVLRELASSELQPMVDILTVLSQANQEALTELLGYPVTIGQYRELGGMSFIKREIQGLSLHDIARMYLLQDLRQREPERLKELRASAARFLHRKIKASGKDEARRVAAQMLLLSKDMFVQQAAYADFAKDALFRPMQPFLESDMPALRELIRQWSVYSIDPWHYEIYEKFLEELALRFPDCIAVLRDRNGDAVGMFITVLLRYETGKLLKRYFPAELAACCSDEEWMKTPDEADTYFAVLCTATDKLPGYTREELVGLQILDRLSLLGDGSRAILIATNDGLKQLLKGLGFRMKETPTRECDTSWAEAHVLELDLRSGNFGDWVLSFFEGERSPRALMPSPPVTEQALRKMLSLLHSPGLLEDYLVYVPGVRGGKELQRKLTRLLEDASAGLSERDRTVLSAAYGGRTNGMEEAAALCLMSRATFYRHLRAAIANAAHILPTLES